MVTRRKPLDIVPIDPDVLAPFALEDPSAVGRFLAARPMLVALLPEIRDELRHRFGQDISFSLQLFSDPEARVARPWLSLAAHVCLDPEPTIECLRSFEREWWIPQWRGEIADMTIGLRFEECP